MANESSTKNEIKAEEDVGKTCELRVRLQRFDRHGNEEHVVVDSLKQPRGHGFDKGFSLVVEQIFTKENRLEKEILTVNSEHILKAFSTIGPYPTVAADFSEPFEMESPFLMLYHYWDDLDSCRDKLDDDVARMHLNLLFEFMETTIGPERKKIATQVKKGQIDFSRAWTLYRPGELQIRFEDGHPWLLKCVKTAYEENTRQGKWIEVHCTYTDFDGKNVGEGTLVTQIHQKRFFASEHPSDIKDLPIYPRSFFERDDTLEQSLRERGEIFFSLMDICIREYDGRADHIIDPPSSYFDPDMALFEPIWKPYKETGRVVVDRKTFQEDNNLARVGKLRSPADADRLLCPPFVYGFSLAVKEWCRFYLPHVRKVEWKKDCMNSLVMKEDQKSLMKALVSSHLFPDNPRDQTKQKGKGLVILLHGSPGSGKTLTAECCAEITKRALFSTSLAELNKENKAWWFEHRLVRVLQYATIWKAVVLFDEADVFLEHRKDDAADASGRNALVAVFLRHLEYFSGIVFLTTNRVHVFDEAMKSRIHLALGYSPPEVEMRKMLWTKSLKAAKGGSLDAEMEEAIDVFIRTKLNGREISNTINTAQTLARYEGQQLQLEHIEQVLNVRKEFEIGLRRVITDAKKTSIGPIARRGSILEAMCEEPRELQD